MAVELRNNEEALRRVATLVARNVPIQELFDCVSEESARVVGALSGAVAIYEGRTARVVGRWDRRGDVSGVPVGTVVSLDEEGATSRAYHTRRAARIDNYEGIPGRAAEAIRAAGFNHVVAAPIMLGEEPWGALVVGSADQIPPEAEDRLFDFAELVSLAASSAEARQRLVESRQRIVEAGDAERQRLGRNLHDGAQQRLISVILTLRLLKTRLGGAESEEIADRAIEEARLAHDELRELARGLHPVALSERGLGPALAALLEHSALPVELDVDGERFPEQLEVAAYYIVAEAVTNAGKHASATRIEVRVRVRAERVEIEVADDGVGGARLEGSGLRGLADRAEALGGELTVASEPGRGTRVHAVFGRDRD